MNRLFINREVKIYILLLIIINLLFWLLLNISLKSGVENMHKAFIRERIALLGIIQDEAPNLEKSLGPLLTGNATDEQFQLGQAMAKRYGLTEELPIEAMGFFLDYQRETGRKLSIYMFLFFALSCGMGLGVLAYIFGKIRGFSDYAESIVEGNFETISEAQEEGDFAILTLQYNQMAKRLQGSLKNLQKEKQFLKEMVSDISHQLKTPLTSIKLLNELLLEGELQNPQIAKEFLTKSHSQIERMEWLIQNLLKMAKLETNSVVFMNERLSIRETIEKAITPLEKFWVENELRLTIKCNGDHIANHDPQWLGEAISNIVKNAIEHTPVGGNITINVTDSPIAYKIQIDNDGMPIPQDEIPRLFQRFYKGKNNKRPNSTGIGLALAKMIIESQNGSIEVRNGKKGPSFIILLYKHESY